MVSVIFSAAYEVLPELLRERREARGVSQRELARLMRRSPSHIGRIEARQRRVEVSLTQALTSYDRPYMTGHRRPNNAELSS